VVSNYTNFVGRNIQAISLSNINRPKKTTRSQEKRAAEKYVDDTELILSLEETSLQDIAREMQCFCVPLVAHWH
jgi:hypothetical protein